MTGPVARSLDELLDGAVVRGGMARLDSLSGATFTRVERDGEPFVVKHLSRASDWVMRATRDTAYRPVQMWEAGLYAALPDCLDATVVGVARFEGGAAVMMRDITPWLVPEGDAPFTTELHRQVVDHLAALHTAFWGWTDDVGLCPKADRWTFLSLRTAAEEAAGTDPVPKAIPGGWARLRDEAPEAWQVAVDLADDPRPLVDAVSRLPQTLVHGDWKGGNLGQLPQGRTALVDWAFPGQDCPLADLAWYLAVNCDRLPESKDDAVRRYREQLEGRGTSTAGWWDDALALSLLVGFVQLGWSKTGEELQWWAGRAVETAGLL